MLTDFAADIPLEAARAAHAGTSFVPDERAHQERNSYAATLAADYMSLERYADTDEKKQTLAREFARYRDGYRRHVLAYLGARSRCLSSMITGPSNFPTRRNDRCNRVADARAQLLLDFRTRALDAIKKTLRPELRPIMSGDGDAVSRLAQKLEQAERLQLQMREVNAAIRKHAKAGADAQVAALVALGFNESSARELIKPDFCGRIGYADYELKNNGANIRTMRQRLESVRTAKATVTTERQGDDGIRVEDSPAENRVRVFFPGKPSSDVRDALKSHGFRWAPSLGCWQAYRNSTALAHAETFAKNI